LNGNGVVLWVEKERKIKIKSNERKRKGTKGMVSNGSASIIEASSTLPSTSAESLWT
jgi:hypothetical protein